ncbi:NAD(P)/FAD-dependent oxidoreductase [Flaviflexus massiliensis]|uniref:NAD(P)/FAD-dependent oxidoreductase n=1 Tax=Flaviflexus massiliensis TaxID=1522309 RepID=UPI0006D57124|nr:NAD(P)/FAD-dependent oxidoreductase [Flaviflexus massiliensis]
MNVDPESVPHVVIVGGGFAGIAAARGLRKSNVRVTLIDRNPYSTFQPLLYQVATSTLNPGDVTYFLRALRRRQSNLRVELGNVETMDHQAQTLTLDDGRVVNYDYLIIGTGVSANFFGIPGAQEHALPLYTRQEAIDVRDRINGLLDAATKRQGEKVRLLIVGGGPTGVETAGALAEMRQKDLPVVYPELNEESVEVMLVDMADQVLGAFSDSSSEYTAGELRRRGVNVVLSKSVKEVKADGVVLKSMGEDETEEWTPAAAVLWASGVTVPKAVSNWGVPQVRGGRIPVSDRLRVNDLPNVFAIGDIAAINDGALPQLAQPAKQTGAHVAKVIHGLVHGGDPGPFKYKDLGILATIGRADAVAEVTHLPKLKGFVAWAIWNVVHLATLLGGRNRISSMVNLGTKYLMWGRSHNLIVGDISDFSKNATEGPLSAARSMKRHHHK